MMPNLYPSWIEIPVRDLDRALAFYRAVFDLTDTPIYDDPPTKIAVLLPSEKSVKGPGVSLVFSPNHEPHDGGLLVNFHIGTHDALLTIITRVTEQGGVVDTEIVDEGDGQRYITLLDSEGNRLALSSYEPPDND